MKQHEQYVMENYPWRNPIEETDKMFVFRDGFPVTEAGHFLFVPKMNSVDNISVCMSQAVQQGKKFVENRLCDGFNVGLNHGTSAGQTVMWPHVHLILRTVGDSENPRGGVRHVIPGKGDYTKNVTNDLTT